MKSADAPPVPAPARERWAGFVDWFNGLGLGENGVLLSFAVAIGVIGALGVAAFYAGIELSYDLLYGWVMPLIPGPSHAFQRPVLTAAALAAASWIMRKPGRGHEGLNIPDVQLAVAKRGGSIPTQPALARTAASAVTIGGGGSAGAEGPVAVLGATVGSSLGRLFNFDASRTRVLVCAGVAAGISAAFNAPLTGAFFALEEILGSFAVSTFPAVVVSSVVAAVVTESMFGTHPAFPVPVGHAAPLAREVFLLYPLLGVVTGAMGVLFIRAYYGAYRLVDWTRLHASWVPWAGGFVVGVGVLLSGGLLVGTGHTFIPASVFGEMAWWVLLALALGKVAFTALTLSAGGSGGVFTPCLYIGAATGGAFGVAAAHLFPGTVLYPQVYALVGMAAVVAAATDVPITGILIVYEMTHDYSLVMPLMLTTVIAYVIARHYQHDSLYQVWLKKRGEDLRGETDLAVLTSLRARDAMDPDPRVIGESATVSQLLEHLGGVGQTHFPVVDERLRVTGMITLNELGRVARDEKTLLPILLAADIALEVDPVAPDDPLDQVSRKMGARGTSTLPVTDPETGRLVGIVDRGHILAVYERTLAGRAEGEGRGY